MSITLNWKLPAGITLDNVVIYRDVTPLNKNSLPAPLVTLPGNSITYVDNTLTSDKVYYYIVSFVKGADVSYSGNYEMGYFSDLGPGPSKLLMGNWTYGYFGEMTPAEFMTAADLKAQLGNPNFSFTEPSSWHKFVYKGKILFIPGSTLVASVTWNALYLAGLIFGTNDTGTFPAAVAKPTPVNQNRRVIVKGYELIVRSPKVGEDLTTTVVIATPDPYSEGMQTIGRMAIYPQGATTRTFWQFSDMNLSGITGWTQNASVSGYYARFSNANTLTHDAPTASQGWTPVLELAR